MKSNNPHESYKYWSSQEDEKLLLCVENNKKNNKINWDAVERLFPNSYRADLAAVFSSRLSIAARTYAAFVSVPPRGGRSSYGKTVVK